MRECSCGSLGLLRIDKENDCHILRNKIARKNDELRSIIPYIMKPDALRITKGVQYLGAYSILKKVKVYNEFTKDDDPYGEHNFGCFMHKDKKTFWTIVAHGGDEGYNLVLTVMLADKW